MNDNGTKPQPSEAEDESETVQRNPERAEQDKKEEVDYGKKMTSSLKKRNEKRHPRR
jgi:hypothetical protein